MDEKRLGSKPICSGAANGREFPTIERGAKAFAPEDKGLPVKADTVPTVVIAIAATAEMVNFMFRLLMERQRWVV